MPSGWRNRCAKTDRRRLDGKTVVLLGAGGAARGAVLALDDAGRRRRSISSTAIAHGPRRLATSLAPQVESAGWCPARWTDWADVAGEAALLVNTTSAGMTRQSAAGRWIWRRCRQDAAVCDIVYNPLETDAAERRRGAGPQDHRWPGHADASGGAVLRSFLRRQAEGDAGLRAALEEALRARGKAFCHRPHRLDRHGQKRNRADCSPAEGVPVYDADAAIHGSTPRRRGGGHDRGGLSRHRPDGAVDRAACPQRWPAIPARWTRLEGLVHPLVAAERDAFLEQARGGATSWCWIFRCCWKPGGRRMDAVVVASAPAHVQRARVLARPGMTADKFAALLARQMPRREKRAKAHFVVDHRPGPGSRPRQVKMILADHPRETRNS